MSEERIKQVHFIGVGGVGMSGIARVAHDQGMQVSGLSLIHIWMFPVWTRSCSTSAYPPFRSTRHHGASPSRRTARLI